MANEGGAGERLSLLGGVLGVMALVLPAIGVAMRWASFTPLSGSALDAAVAAPVTKLVAVTIPAMTTMAVGLALALAFAWMLWRARIRSVPLPTFTLRGVLSRSRIVESTVLLMTSLLLAVYLYTRPGFPQTLIWVAAGGLAGMYLMWLAQFGADIRLATVWPVVAIFALGGVTSAALSPAGVGVALSQITFVEGSALRDGPYWQLGSTDGVAYLVKCGSNRIEAVPVDSIARATPRERQNVPRSPATTFDWLLGKSIHVGFSTAC